MRADALTSSHLGNARHGFFTRRGGVSSGVYASLNCGPGSADLQSRVTANRSLVAEAMSVGPGSLVSLHQVHSARVVEVKSALKAPCKADAIVSRTPGIAIGVLAADCAPILLSANEGKIVGAVHAGWKGALDGVIETAVRAMENLGARADSMAAVVGPCISRDAYEVGPEYRQRFIYHAAENSEFFSRGSGDKYFFDLPAFCLARLFSAGVSASTWIGHCTYSDPGKFFSYRRSVHANEPDYGRQISAIAANRWLQDG